MKEEFKLSKPETALLLDGLSMLVLPLSKTYPLFQRLLDHYNDHDASAPRQEAHNDPGGDNGPGQQGQ